MRRGSQWTDDAYQHRHIDTVPGIFALIVTPGLTEALAKYDGKGGDERFLETWYVSRAADSARPSFE